MKQWHFKMKKLCSKTHKSLINKQTSACEKLHRKKLFVLYIVSILPNIEEVEIPCLHSKVALVTRRRSEWGTRNRQQRIFRKV